MSQDKPKQAPLKILVLDSYELFLDGITEIIRQQYPYAEIITAQTADAALNQIVNEQPHLIIMELVLAEKPGMIAQTHTGIQLLKNLMQNYPHLHIVVQSDYLKTLVQLKQEINAHLGGFTVANKRFANKEMLLTRANWALQGLTHTKDIKGIHAGLEVKSEWLNLLTLAFHEGLQDKKIAQRISVSERMVRHHWDKLQEALGLDCEYLKKQGKNLRILTQIRAREEGLIE